jgi:hypothetical protein
MIVVMCNRCEKVCINQQTQKSEYATIKNDWAISENFLEEHHLCKDCFLEIIKDFKKY